MIAFYLFGLFWPVADCHCIGINLHDALAVALLRLLKLVGMAFTNLKKTEKKNL